MMRKDRQPFGSSVARQRGAIARKLAIALGLLVGVPVVGFVGFYYYGMQLDPEGLAEAVAFAPGDPMRVESRIAFYSTGLGLRYEGIDSQ